MKGNTQRSANIPVFVAVLGRQGPSIQRQSKTQTASIESRDGRRKLTKRNIHLLRSGKKSQNSLLHGEHAAIHLPPTKITESTKETPKRATLHTDGRCRCVVGVNVRGFSFWFPPTSCQRASFQAHLGAASGRNTKSYEGRHIHL
jgi:hypothetical protein